MKLIDFFDRGARLFPGRTCFRHADGDHGYTYRKIEQLTHQIANGLISVGIGPSDSFAVYTPNHTLAFASLLGGLRVGAKWVNLNARGTPQEAAHALLKNACACLFYHSAFSPHLAEICANAPSVRTLICIDAPPPSGGLNLLDWARCFEEPAPDAPMSDEDVAALFSTGGTTGQPKSACLSNRAFTAMTSGFLAELHFEETPTQLLVAPMTHAAGALTFPLLALGATTVVLPEAKPSAILTALEEHRINLLFLPPTVIYMLLAEPKVREIDYSALKYFLYAAAPMAPAKLAEAMDIFGPVMMQTYGQVEAPMILTCLTREDHVEALADPNKRGRLASCGRASHVARVEIMDENGALLGAGERGEIVCRGSLIMSGYRDAPDENAAAQRFGWHHTGDVGYRDADGYIYIVDRLKDMIITGGFNVFPSEVEAFLLTFPEIQDCAVVGVPDEKWGEAIKAILELKQGAHVDTDAVLARCKQSLGGVKCPKSIEIWPTLPRSAVGKVLKRAVRDVFWQGRDRVI